MKRKLEMSLALTFFNAFACSQNILKYKGMISEQHVLYSTLHNYKQCIFILMLNIFSRIPSAVHTAGAFVLFAGRKQDAYLPIVHLDF